MTEEDNLVMDEHKEEARKAKKIHDEKDEMDAGEKYMNERM